MLASCFIWDKPAASPFAAALRLRSPTGEATALNQSTSSPFGERMDGG